MKEHHLILAVIAVSLVGLAAGGYYLYTRYEKSLEEVRGGVQTVAGVWDAAEGFYRDVAFWE